MLARRGRAGAKSRGRHSAERRFPIGRLRRAGWQEEDWRDGWEPAPSDAPLEPAGDPDADVTAEVRMAADPGAGPVSRADNPGAGPVGRADNPGDDPAARTSYARAWAAPQPDPADARELVVGFRRSAVALALSADEGSTSGEHAREGAASLVALASAAREDLLGAVLRADPERDDVTWTVACYQIGDLSPSTLRDFADASSAVRCLAGCGDPAHVAAELIVTNGDAIRWTALVRSGADVTFQLLEAATASAPTSAALLDVRHRWEDQLMDWAARPAAGVEDPGPAEGLASGDAVPAPPAVPGDSVAVGMALGQLLESVRRIEQRLAPEGAGSPGEHSAVGSSARVERLERELDALRRELAASARRVAALEAALGASVGRPDPSPAGGLVVAGGPAVLSAGQPDVAGPTWSR